MYDWERKFAICIILTEYFVIAHYTLCANTHTYEVFTILFRHQFNSINDDWQNKNKKKKCQITIFWLKFHMANNRVHWEMETHWTCEHWTLQAPTKHHLSNNIGQNVSNSLSQTNLMRNGLISDFRKVFFLGSFDQHFGGLVYKRKGKHSHWHISQTIWSFPASGKLSCFSKLQQSNDK